MSKNKKNQNENPGENPEPSSTRIPSRKTNTDPNSKVPREQAATPLSDAAADSNASAFEKIDQLIKSGQVSSAAQMIVQLIRSHKTFLQKLQPEERLTLGNLARRAGMALTSLKILRPVIRALREGTGHVTDAEKAAYAAGLISLGVLAEAESILTTVDESAAPEALLFLGLGLFAQWRYGEAIGPLRRYISSPKISDYQKWVGRLNLSAALLVEQKWREAESLIETSLKELLATPHVLLRMFFEEQRVQLLIEQKKYSDAALSLQRIYANFPQRSAVYQVTLLKWQTVIEWSRGELYPEQMLARLDHLAEQAQGLNLSEILREVDFYRALFLNDSQSYQKIVCGTPWPTYLERLRRSFLQNGSFDSVDGLKRQKQFAYSWTPKADASVKALVSASGKAIASASGKAIASASGRQSTLGEDSASALGLDRLSGWFVGFLAQKKRRVFKFDSLEHRLFYFLSADFYKPLSLGYLFSQLYPGEHFNPFSSPQRVQQLVHRLNKRIQPLGFKVQSKRQVFYLEGNSSVRTLKNFASTRAKWDGDTLNLKRCFFSSRFFDLKISNADLQQALDIDAETARRILVEGEQEGVLKSQGQRGQRRYRLITEKMPEKTGALALRRGQ